MIIRKTTKNENPRVNEVFAIAFELPIEIGPACSDSPDIHHWAAFDDDNLHMMSALTVFDYKIHFDGHSCKMGGIGGVSTLPQYRRRGGIRGCFEKALPAMYEEGYDFSYLYPFSTEYYRKFGYESCVQKYRLSLRLNLLDPPSVPGHFQLTDKTDPMTDAIRAIDRVWEHQYNMMVLHDDDFYSWCSKVEPAIKQEFTYVYFGGDETPKAYTTFRKTDEPDGRNVICSRFFFSDREGFFGLMNLFKSLSTDHKFAKLTLPVNPAMQYLMPEWSRGAAHWNVLPAGMVRVIRVKEVLEQAVYQGSGTIALKIEDPQIPQNNHTYTVTFSDGHAASVTASQDEPDAVLDISAFSALICGVSDWKDSSAWMNGIHIIHPHACFDQVFYRKPLLIVDDF